MYGLSHHHPDLDRKFFSVDFGNDKSILFRIRYIGSAASGIVDIASTGDITFKHGVLSSEAVDDDTKLDAGGVGIIDISDDITDYHSLVARINSSDNWEAWAVGYLPGDDPHTTTTGHFTEVTGGNCSTDTGYGVMTDDSDSKYIVAGLTYQGPSTKIHGTDHQVEHVVGRVIALSTYGSGASTLKIYECDDDGSGSSNEILNLSTGATTVEVAYPAETSAISTPLAWTRGKRIVVKLVNEDAMSVVRLKLEAYSVTAGPSVRKSKMHVEQLDG